jgi:uncharacterized membrane protein YhaH (DUF805 family)
MSNIPDSEQLTGGIMDSYSDTQKEILAIEKRKTRNKLFIIAAVILISDLLALFMANAVNSSTLLASSIVPLIFFGLALLATKEPLLAMILGAAMIVALWVFLFVQFGNRSLVSGWLVKAVLITLVISGFRNAIEANNVRKEMR